MMTLVIVLPKSMTVQKLTGAMYVMKMLHPPVASLPEGA